MYNMIIAKAASNVNISFEYYKITLVSPVGTIDVLFCKYTLAFRMCIFEAEGFTPQGRVNVADSIAAALRFL